MLDLCWHVYLFIFIYIYICIVGAIIGRKAAGDLKCRCRAQVHGKEDLQKLLDLEPHGSCQRNTAHHCWAGNGCSLPWPLKKERECVWFGRAIFCWMFAFYCACCFFPTSLCGVLVLVLYPVVRRLLLLLLRHAPPPTPPCHTQSFTHISLTYISHIQLCHTHTHTISCVWEMYVSRTHTCLWHTSLTQSFTHTRQEMDHWSDPLGTESPHMQLD